jgi:hypothetical protein
MSAKNIIVGICCFSSFSSYSFGVKINGKSVPVRNRNDMKKVYKIITPMIETKEKKSKENFAIILAKAYMEYANTGKNLNKDQKDDYFWPHLGNIGQYYIKYEERDKSNKQFRMIKTQILNKLEE